jgi:MULE transposase domain
MSLSKLYDDINSSGGHSWESPLYLVVYTSVLDPPNSPGQLVDLCSTMNSNRRILYRKRSALLQDCWYLPHSFNTVKDREPVNNYIFEAAAAVGMKLVVKQHNQIQVQASEMDKRQEFMWKTVFECYRKKPECKKDGKVSRETQRATASEVRCTFFFSMYFDFRHRRWFFPSVQGGCPSHVGHPKPDDPKLLDRSTRCVTDADMETMLEQFRANFPPSMVGAWFREHKDVVLSRHQVRGLQKKHQQSWSLFNIPDEHVGFIDALMAFLRESNTIDSVVLSGHRSTAETDVTVTLSTRQRELYHEHYQTLARNADPEESGTENNRPTARSSTQKVNYHVSALPVLEMFDHTDNHETAKTHAQAILHSLRFTNETVNGEEKVFLGVAWIDHEALNEWYRYPYVIGFDDKMGTSNQNFPLGTVVAVDGQRRNIPTIRVYTPNKKRWSYQWIFSSVFPKIVPEFIRHRTLLIITDACPRTTERIDAAIKTGVFPRARRRLCAWHRIDNNIKLHGRSHYAKKEPVRNCGNV